MTINSLTETILIKMSILNQKDVFKVLERHENCNIKFMSATRVNKNAKLTLKNVLLTDFEQGKIGNCGLIAALGAVSQRPEFLSEIAPKVEHTSEGIKLHFNMFFKGKPTTVTIDDKLPFKKPSFFEWLFFGKRPSLIYARSSNDDNLYLASLFEKAVVKLVCSNDYKNSDGIPSRYVFSLFSDCMVSCCNWLEKDLKQNVLDHLKYEVDNKSSVVLVIKPSLNYKPENIEKDAHAYVVMDFNLKHNAIKLYDHSMCINYFTDFETNLPLSITDTADLNKGERWITLDQLEKRNLTMNSLCSKNMYKSIFKVSRNFKLTDYDEKNSKVKFAYQVDVKETSIFMINLLSFTNNIEELDFCVFTDDNKEQEVELNNEIPPLLISCQTENEGEANTTSYQKFKIQPNKYVFSFEISFEETSAKKVDLLLKIGSTSECTFEEIKNEEKTWSKSVKGHICSYTTCKIFFIFFYFVHLVYYFMLILYFT